MYYFVLFTNYYRGTVLFNYFYICINNSSRLTKKNNLFLTTN